MKINISGILVLIVIAFCIYLFVSSIKGARENVRALNSITHTDFLFTKRDSLLYPADFLNRITKVRTDYYESSKIVQSLQISDSLEIFIIELLSQKPVISKPEILNKEILNPVRVSYISNNFGNFDLQVASNNDTILKQIAFFIQDGYMKYLFADKINQLITISTSAIGYRNLMTQNLNVIVRRRNKSSRKINGCAFFHTGKQSAYIGFILKNKPELTDAYVNRESFVITSFLNVRDKYQEDQFKRAPEIP